MKLNQFIAHQSRFRNVICTVRYLGNDRMKVFFSPWKESSRLISKIDLNKTNNSFVCSSIEADTNHSTSNTQGEYRLKKRVITSSLCAHATYSVRASWELSIFSFLTREEGRKTLHACNLKCENERKERALFELLEIWVELTCHSKSRLHEYQDGGCFGVWKEDDTWDQI